MPYAAVKTPPAKLPAGCDGRTSAGATPQLCSALRPDGEFQRISFGGGESGFAHPRKGFTAERRPRVYPAVNNNGTIALTDRRLIFITITGKIIDIPAPRSPAYVKRRCSKRLCEAVVRT